MKKAIVTPSELFVLGKIMNAEYIDYAYIAAMTDTGKDYELFKKETTAGLVSKGLLEEDFSGKITPAESIVDIFTPVFFGRSETTVDRYITGEAAEIKICKFHFNKDNITSVNEKEGLLEVERADEEAMIGIVKGIASDVSDTAGASEEIIADSTDASEIIALKSTVIGEKSATAMYMKYNRKMYKQASDGSWKHICIDAFINEMILGLKGVI